ncbi:pyridoxamine 5'-phosphate oxidase family protein [Streptomyces sp. NBC_01334]|uniref:pyridoxamine 5'-phosphate oxidase family protein n=1 Tax=Streptomyces sp. NBC_01334 TaxID=2903827 RepID=UPI003FA39104
MPTDERLAVDLLARTQYGRVAASLRAMPFLACARHIVVDGRLLLRMHRGHGYHRACAGHVVAYGSDNLDRARPGSAEGRWSVAGGDRREVRVRRTHRRRTGGLRARAPGRGRRRPVRPGLPVRDPSVRDRAPPGSDLKRPVR